MTHGLAYVFTAPGRPLTAQPRQFGPPGADETLVEVIGCGLCHTDLGYFDGSVPTKKPPPIVLGHEVVGRVVGSGRLVLIPAVLPCGHCAFCRAGRGNACPEQQMPGNDIDGGFATHQLVRSAPLVALPDGIPEVWKLGVVADAVSTAYQAVRRSGLTSGDVAVVVGAGGVGGFAAQIAAAKGAHVMALDVKRARLDLALQHGASHALDVSGLAPKAVKAEVRAFLKKHGLPSLQLRIFECTGTRAGQSLAFGLIDRGATLVQVGYTPESVEVRLSNLMAFDATVHGTWGCPVEVYPAVIDLVASGKVKLDPFVERAPMSQLNQHLEAMAAHRLERRLVLDPLT
ncbi:MAG TPA: 6-hydroxycyclohex-1-ene-1-carbonyl-CoA dehydrogenase [Myxococcales bacterium]|nr:6-hydroxycyclohex-1-ene-1-carbonyl-CoA dehydrogenase [Myxococcales bacterium]